MERKGISQETLKIIACVTMLVDHIGAVFLPGEYSLRVIGRIAFPIYCFLLVEGIHYTGNPWKYGLRLLAGMLLSEIPFDLALKGGLTWGSQSVMVTLLLGFLAVEAISLLKHDILKLAVTVAACALAELLHTDYGGFGVLLIILLSQTRGRLWLQTILLALVCWMMNSFRLKIGGFLIPIEIFGVAAMVPIALYSGKKGTSSKAVQWAFYLFYPVHLTVIYLLR